MPITTKGDKTMLLMLAAIGEKGARRATRSATAAGARVLAKHVKQRVPGRYKDARASIGSRLLRRKEVGGQLIASKAGFGVGRQRPPKRSEAKDGVGLSARNIHWGVLGTQERIRRDGQKTGYMPALFGGVLKDAAAASETRVQITIRRKFRERVEAEMVKLLRKL